MDKKIAHIGDLVFEKLTEGLYVLVADRKQKVRDMVVDIDELLELSEAYMVEVIG